MQKFKQFVPVIVMVVMAVLQAVNQVLGDGVTLNEVFVVLVALAGAVATYLVPSVADRAPWAKTVVAAFTAGAVILQDATVEGGLTTSVIMTAVIAVLAVVGSAAGEPEARDYQSRHALAA